MIDSTTINFAIDKMSQAWMKAAPHLESLSVEYIEFVVMRVVVAAVLLGITLVISLPILIKGIIKECEYDWEFETPWGLFVIVGAIGTLVGLIGIISTGYDAILAINCPEMYTIHEIINASK